MKIKIMRQPKDLNAQTKNKKTKKIKNEDKKKNGKEDRNKQRPERVFEPILTR